MSLSLWPHELQHARLPCLSLCLRVCSSSCPLSQWCHPTISSSVDPFSSRPQSLPASGSFPVSQIFALGGQSIGASASAPILSMKIQGWLPLGLSALLSLLSRGLSTVFSSITVQKHNSLLLSLLYSTTLTSINDYWEKHSFGYRDLCRQSEPLLCNTLSRFVIGFLPRSKRLLILLLPSLSVVIMESKKMKSDAVSTFSPSICHQVVGSDAMVFVFWMLSFKPVFSLSSFPFIKRLLVPLHFLPLKSYHLYIWGCWHFFWQYWFQLVLYLGLHFHDVLSV